MTCLPIIRTELPQQDIEKITFAKNEAVTIQQQVVGEFEKHPIFQIPWGHQIQIISQCKSVHEALFYVQKTIENGWSRAVLMNFLDVGLYMTQGKALTNFSRLLPEVQSDLAKEILKDPYNFDFQSAKWRFRIRIIKPVA